MSFESELGEPFTPYIYRLSSLSHLPVASKFGPKFERPIEIEERVQRA